MASSSCLLLSIPSCSYTGATAASIDRPKSRGRRSYSSSIRCGALKSAPKGFGELPSSSKKRDESSSSPSSSIATTSNLGQESSAKGEEDDDTVPEVVTNRMLKRMIVTVGAPLGTGFLAFPAYYFAKSALRMEFPQVLPMITSFLLFGLSGFGILYAVVSTSWDPLREGSVLGWDEARVNWNLVWQKRDEDDD
ncbi:protein PAM68, chloroplastic-like [Selaginella moellendorffii]|uniref:protein PAM68, chloroplastic-like n=1 Tax=Selaginella moellendorffii TaxID=88036 RepID=UPI000D1CB2D8|nr:protein PAM68, chloroplastic-like [Selaginella moellendorffii]|eukprot:XP_024540897.1 protein PAM68, chloroplastic-like [Selaginella moellendorffii]